MSIIRPEDVFDHERFNQVYRELESAVEAFADGTINSFTRVKGAFDLSVRGAAALRHEIDLVNVTQTNAGKVLHDYAVESNKTTVQLNSQRQTLASLTEVNRLNSLVVEQSRKRLAELQVTYSQLDPSQKNYNSQQKAITTETRVLVRTMESQSKILRQGKTAMDAAEGSYLRLQRQTAELRQRLIEEASTFNLTSGQIEKHNVKAREMVAIIERNDRVLREADAQMGRNRQSIGGYGASLKGLAADALLTAGAVVGIGSAFDAVQATLGIISDFERIDASLKAVSKDTADFNQTQQFLIATADQLGLKYEVLAESYKGIKAATRDTALEGKATEQVFSGIVRSGAALKLSNEAVEGTLRAVTQIMSKGKVQAEELRSQLGEHLPGAVRLLSQAMGISEAKLNKMMEQGELLAVDVLPKLAKQLDKTYGKDAQSNVETMAGGWNLLTNQVHLFIAALNDNGAMSATANNFTNMLAEMLRGIRSTLQSGDWQSFWGQFAPGEVGKQARQTIANNGANERVINEFRTMTPAQRRARIDLTKESIDRNTSELEKRKDTVLGGNVDEIKNRLKRDNDLLLKLQKENLKLTLKDRKDAEQAEINEQRAAATRKEAEADKLAKKAKEAQAARRKAETEADRRLRESLSKSKENTDNQLSGLTSNQQDGLISEQEFLEKRLKITLAGIEERRRLLERAGKKETDDYKAVLTEKLDADTQYKRDQLKLDLNTVKGESGKQVATLDTQKNDGSITEADYIEKRHQVIQAGIDRQLTILSEAGQTETKLYRDLNTEKLEEEADYFRRRAKVAEQGFREQLKQTKDSLEQIDGATASSLNTRLGEIESTYQDQERKISVAVARRQMTEQEGENQLYAAKMKMLEDSMQAVESAYQQDETLSRAVSDAKIKAIEDWKNAAERTPAEIAAAEEAINNERKAIEKNLADDKKKQAEEVSDFQKKKSDETTDHEVKNAKKSVEERNQLWAAGLQTANDIGQAINSINSAYAQQDQDRLAKQREYELSIVGDNADARAKIEENFAKKKAEIARRAAIQERAAALFSIAINTATAIMSVLSTGGGAHYLDFGTSAGILSALVTATGIAQAAAVIAAPLPAYKTGKEASDPYTGKALAGEAGTELFIDREGYATLLTKPTIIDTKKGDVVLPAAQTAQLLRANPTAGILDEMQMFSDAIDHHWQGEITQKIMVQQAAYTGLSKSDMREVLGDALDSRPVQETYFDENGVSEFVRKGQNRTQYLNRRNSFK